MEKLLHLVRHGKSSWDMTDIEDFDRSLTEKGIRNNHIISRRFILNFPEVGLIVTSPATRAVATAICFARTLKTPTKDISINNSLYFAGLDSIFKIIKNAPDNINSLMLVGHNPELTELLNLFLPSLAEEMPTSSVASISFKAERWDQISPQVVSEWFFDYPKKS
jgi:phosphohistidine phosphatase